MDDAQRTAATNSYRAKYLRFPLDTKNTPYAAKIKFTARELESFDVNFLFNFAGIKTTNKPTRPGDELSELDKIAEKKRLLDAINSANKGAGTSEINQGTGQTLLPGNFGSATLYLPQAIQITDTAAYSNTNLGILGAGTQKGLAQGADILPTLMTETRNAAASIIDAIIGGTGDKTDLAKLGVNRASKMLPGEGFRGAVSSATRVSVNPNTRAIFDSVPLREFVFTFKLIPTSKEEAKVITAMIKFFRENLYPEVITMGGINAGYKFPHVFTIDLKYNDNTLATKILPSYIRSFAATYNSSGMGFLSDGEGGGDFSEVDITMAFMESGTLHKKLIQEQGY